MKLTAQIKLNPTPEQADALRRTLETANAACDTIARIAWDTQTFRQFALHTLVYEDVRTAYGLGAQVVVRCISKVADAYKLDRDTLRTFQPHGALAYDARCLSFNLAGSAISIWTLDGRLPIPFVCGEHQRTMLPFQKGESDLVYRRGEWFLYVTCEMPAAELQEVDSFLGIDLGIVNIATDSDGEAHSGAKIEARRLWYANRRAALQKVGTKSAKRRLRQLSGRQRRFQTDTNHILSKRLVATAERTKRGIALEDLTGIRSRARARGPQQRARHSNWAFGQLRGFLSYKAQRLGIPVVLVDPRNTSRTCSVCGHCEKANRRSQAVFCCQSCGHQSSADVNAAINIKWAAVNRPLVSDSARAG
jgi:putative transposase